MRAISTAVYMPDSLHHPAVPMGRLSRIAALSPLSGRAAQLHHVLEHCLPPPHRATSRPAEPTAAHWGALLQSLHFGTGTRQDAPSRETLQVLARWLGLPVSYFVADSVGGLGQLAAWPRPRRTRRAHRLLVRQDALLRMLGEAEVLLRQRAADAALRVLGSPTPPGGAQSAASPAMVLVVWVGVWHQAKAPGGDSFLPEKAWRWQRASKSRFRHPMGDP